jgi:uncharacterized protein (DUF2062 family)
MLPSCQMVRALRVDARPNGPHNWAVQPFRWISEEAAAFRAALSAAPEPRPGWDFFGLRRFSGKVWGLMLAEHSSPGRLAAAVFIGILIGVSPFYGFHVVGALAVAWAFKLNKLVVWLGTNVSIPPISAIFAFASAQVGSVVMTGHTTPLSWEEFKAVGLGDALIYWLVGFPVVGCLFGGLVAGLLYVVASRRVQLRVSAD